MTEVLIIGAGPAGLAAALQLKRRGVDFILFERQRVGGLLNNANWVENYPGFPGGIAGEKLVELFYQQVTDLGVEITYEEVQHLDYAEGWFRAETPLSTYQAAVVIVATGTIGNIPQGIAPPAIKERVLTEILTINGLTGKRVVIIGAGDLAFDYGLNLGRSNQVIILNRTRERKCLPLLWERARQMPSVNYREQSRLEGIEVGEDGGLRLLIISATGQQDIACDYLVCAIGRRANTSFISRQVIEQMDILEQEQVLFRIGDVKNGIYRQAAIAVGDGILAAMHIIKNIEESNQ